MRILFDHCVPKPHCSQLPGFEIRTCFEEGWEALRNGDLLAAAETAGFQVFITADRYLRYQQNLSTRNIAIIELPRNCLTLLISLAPAITKALTAVAPAGYIEIPMP